MVLDIGPGSGTQIRHFDPVVNSISKAYCIEPSIDLHPLLRKNIALTGLGREGKCEALVANATGPSIAQELKRVGVVSNVEDASELFDTVVCVRVLCSVPDLNTTIADLWKLLKPGGKMLVLEHTANPWKTPQGSMIARFMQTFYMLVGWSFFVGDCQLTRDIQDVLTADPKRWEKVEISRHFGQSVICYISGVLVKRH